jgi:hypothetical protein
VRHVLSSPKDLFFTAENSLWYCSADDKFMVLAGTI